MPKADDEVIVLNAPSSKPFLSQSTKQKRVEAPGVEPGSENAPPDASTCVVSAFHTPDPAPTDTL
jgi:hypothetical protein